MRVVPITALLLCSAQVCSASDSAAAQNTFFEEQVRPLLAKRCFRCHSEKKHAGNLRLDARSLILHGGESGPAMIPGKPDESLLISAVRYRSLEMPPDRRLSNSEVDVLVRWVRTGAIWPGQTGESLPAPRSPGLQITGEDRRYWAFQPLQKQTMPDDPSTDWDDSSMLDAFVLQKLSEQQLAPAGPASRRQLARRVYFDLIGLPPSFADVERFVADESPDAFRNLVNELLARPQYGERWGRHWLDVVRFAQTNGYERDDEKPDAWRYRDYVIRSFNADKPFDQFIIEQLAGDEIDIVTHDSIIATGYYRLGVWDDEPDDKTAAIYDGLADIVRTTGEVFLGLTIGCARCHDHKFDPIPQADYYSLLSFVRNIAPYGRDKSQTHWELDPDAAFTPLLTTETVESWSKTLTELDARLAELKQQLAQADDSRKDDLNKQISDLQDRRSKPPWDRALSVREPGSQPPETRILVRGNHLTPGEAVTPAFLSVISPQAPDLTTHRRTPVPEFVRLLRSQGVQPTTGRRRVLAEWIASPDNPLTARVIANRLWHHHFGRGIVATPNDFGRTGRQPTHPELLDWLASELIDHGWSLKHLHRIILLSRTWQQNSSPPADSQAFEQDPENSLLWKQNLRRVESEVIRDSILTVSGQLNLEPGGRGFFPTLSPEVLSTQSRSGAGWGQSDERQRSRRSIYIYAKRTLGVPMMEAFDTPVPDRPEPARQTTTIAPQAL
ncbi:MAG: PSD1 and planctomycete cytochrome C domain-containing protein, partial [Planctomycetaceae bacterium]